VTTFDAYVDHNSGTDRELTLAMIDDAIENALTYGANRKNLIFLTGYDTYMDINALLEGKHRILQGQTVRKTVTLNGVETPLEGFEGGFAVASYDGIPIFTGQNVASDTKSRIYLLDLDNLYIAIAKPTVYLETKPDDYLLADVLQSKRALMTGLQLICTKFNTQGKIRDLK
jgi:hypothetical protein